MARQLSFELPGRTVLGREDFFVSPANAMAVAMVEQPGTWPNGKLVLTGSRGSGKTHLSHVWSTLTGARITKASALSGQDIPDLARTSVVVEDVPDIVTDNAAQSALFHLHNLVLAEGHRLLLTGREPPNLWALTLPDLQSRMQGAAHISLESPDDVLLAAVMAKLFSDRQITPKPDVIPYLVTRINRSFRSAASIVRKLDQASLDQGRTVSRKLAADLLGDSGNTP